MSNRKKWTDPGDKFLHHELNKGGNMINKTESDRKKETERESAQEQKMFD